MWSDADRVDHKTPEQGNDDDSGTGQGHLSNRLNLERKDEIGVLAKAMDQFADHLQKNVIFNMQQISEGNINIEPAIIDERDEIGPAIKMMAVNIRNLVKEMNVLTMSALEGKLDVSGNARTLMEPIRKSCRASIKPWMR